jgi:hypothetical protein
VGSVVGEDGVDPAGDGFDQAAQEVRGRAARHLLMQFDEGELRGPIDRDEEMELSLNGSNLGDVGMEISDRVSLELALGRSFAFDLWRARDSMTLQTPVKGRARQVWDRRLEARRGNRRAAAGYAFGRRSPRPLPPRTGPMNGASSAQSADRRLKSNPFTWRAVF